MSDIVTLRHESLFADGQLRPFKYAKSDVAASATDSSLVAAVTGKRIVVIQAVWVTGTTATTVVFNSKGSGAGTAISGTFSNDINGGVVLPFSQSGWFETNVGEALTCTTGAGSTTGITLTYIEEPA
jgi:hypothetical protein